jgi:hypothetical protein
MDGAPIRTGDTSVSNAATTSATPHGSRGNIVGLAPAHTGYMYQDLVTAYFMAQALIERFDLRVDKKQFEGDIFDDLHLVGRRRIQLKSSLTSSDPFSLEDLSTKRRNTRIDELLFATREDHFAAAEYRLSATWQHPQDARLQEVLTVVHEDSSFGGTPTVLFKLEPEALKPHGVTQLARHLCGYTDEEIAEFCKRFRLELECPKASLDLGSPGPLEALLFDTLRRGIGVGIFPNEDLQVVDTAANLINFATFARAGQRIVKPSDTIKRLRLRIDYGRIAQQFPVNTSVLVRRASVEDALTEFAGKNSKCVVVGEPGAGKSWLLTQVTDSINQNHGVAIRHYCYLEPTDREIQRRVTSRVMFGNLMAELLEVRPDLSTGSSPRYAASAEAFERLLSHTDENDHIYIVVDGIDHISRVFHQSPSLAAEDIDIVQQLALLNLPVNVHLIVGSQPGPHLSPLQSRNNMFPLPQWQPRDVENLAEKMSLLAVLATGGHDDQNANVLQQIAQRSEGNPLYATFMVREVVTRATQGEAVDILSLIDQIPYRMGDLGRYYDYLFERIKEHQAVSVAETFALLDFGVSQSDLKEIYPAEAHRLSGALPVLAPILEQASAQGGFRIYHESFRRFVMEKLVAQEASINSRLGPVCSWLEQKGFLSDSRAYRFLLPTLRRADRDQEILDRLTPRFMQDSLRNGHPSAAIALNLVVGAEVAARTQSWEILARINELQRANSTYRSERLGDVAMYGKAFAALRGAEELNERLLFEGRPTFDREAGLLLCDVCDRAGAVPPWREYFRLSPSSETKSFSQTQVTLAWFRGWTRLHGIDAAVQLVLDWARDFPDDTDVLYGAVEILRSLGGDTVPAKLLEATIPTVLREVLLIERLHHAKRMGHETDASTHAKALLTIASNLSTCALAVKAGGDASTLATPPAPSSYEFENLRLGEADVRLAEWTASLTIALRRGESVAAERQRARGVGWYRYWLQYVVAIAEAEALSQQDRDAGKLAALIAFDLLVEDTRPFVGDPRACDLYAIHTNIFDSIRDGLDLLDHDPALFEALLPKLVKITDDTTTSFRNEEGGPLDTAALFNLLSEFVENPALTDMILPVLEAQRAERTENRGYYTALAVQELHLCHIYARLSRHPEAESHWSRACSFLAAYGHRKDITFVELLDGQTEIAKLEGAGASDLIARTQPLIAELVAHTDGKGTRHFPVDWFEGLVTARPIQAAILLSQRLAGAHGRVDWRLESGLEVLLLALRGTGDALLLSLLWSSFFDEKLSSTIHARLETLHRLCRQYPAIADEFYQRFAAEVEGDSPTFDPKDLERVLVGDGRSHSTAAAISGVFATPLEEHPSQSWRPGRSIQERFYFPTFAPNATPFELLAQVRKVGLDDDMSVDAFVNSLGFRLVELVEATRDSAEVEVLLKQIAKENRYTFKADRVYPALAEGFERIGMKRLASLCYALAFTRTRGSGGWFALGDKKHAHLFQSAIQLNQTVAYEALAEELLSHIDGDSYVAGLTQHLVTLFCQMGQPSVARSVWLGAFEVVERRFPRDVDDYDPLDKFDPAVPDPVSLDVALCCLLLSRIVHPDLRKKRAGIAGAAYVLRYHPASFAIAAKRFLEADDSFTAKLVLLTLLERFELAPYPISIAVGPILAAMAIGSEFGICEAARSILRRVDPNRNFDTRSRVTLSNRAINAERAEAILEIDRPDRVTDLEALWPEFPDVVSAYFDEQWEKIPDHKQIEKRRLELINDPSSRRLPVPPILDWHSELFEFSLHRTLNHLDLQLWRQGSPDTPLLKKVADHVSPRVDIYVRHWLSRVMRPNMPLPSQLPADYPLLGQLPTTDSHAGWVRIAYYEMEWLLLEKSVPATVTKNLRISASFGIPRPGESFPVQGSLPFGMGEVESWRDSNSYDPLFRWGPLVGLTFLNDFLGILPVLALPRRLTNRLPVKVSDALGRLQLLDMADEPCVIFRQWHVRPLGERLSRSADRNWGCDLIATADTWKVIGELFPDQLIFPSVHRSEDDF